MYGHCDCYVTVISNEKNRNGCRMSIFTMTCRIDLCKMSQQTSGSLRYYVSVLSASTCISDLW